VSNTARIIMIWGGLIALYLFLSHSKGTSAMVGSFQQFVSGTTKTLQGRDNG
jgi:hypothetical protein